MDIAVASSPKPVASPSKTDSPSTATRISRLVSDLSKKMSRRQSPDELSQKHILPVESAQHSVASSIVQAKHQLEQEKAKNSLNRKLSLRPTKDDLKLRNIIKGSSDNVALISQEHHHNFESAASSASSSYLPEPPRTFERKQAELKSILKKRPEKAELQNMHILKYGSDISIIESQEREKKNQIESKLASHLLQRPDVTSLKQSKILFFSDEIEVAATYKKTEYNRRPEEDSTFKRLTPQLKNQIREELNTFKKNEMVVHEDKCDDVTQVESFSDSPLSQDKSAKMSQSQESSIDQVPERKSKKNVVRLKLLSMGQPATGKSCLIKRFCEEKFTSDYIATIGIDYGVKSLPVGDKEVRLSFWDSAGDDHYFEIRNEFYSETNAAMLVYDASRRETFDALQKWINELLTFCQSPVHLFLVGNKVDVSDLQVTAKEGQEFADKSGAKFFEASAESGQGVTKLFETIIGTCLSVDEAQK